MTMRELLRAAPSLAGPFPRFDPDAAPADPVALFRSWFDAANAASIAEPHAVVLSTVDADGHPDARVLILKDVDAQGWQVASTRAGPKGRQIAAYPHVALTVYWQALGRQVRIRGTASEREESAGHADFRRRSAEARAIALAGRQSEVLDDPAGLEAEIARQRRHLVAHPDAVAPDWTVYAVWPLTVEFWQGDTGRRHTRLLYRREGQGWHRDLLRP